MIWLRFQCGLGLKSGKICKNNDHICLFHCINTCRVPRTMFEHSAKRPCSRSFLGTRQMLMHTKKCVIPIIKYEKYSEGMGNSEVTVTSVSGLVFAQCCMSARVIRETLFHQPFEILT